uniref:BPTI/Kunitz inhibitor domain-containing protein n=1 Tax=Amazona collaria TaxID=241587 RepID=A0A8B9FS67_9PSIT
MGTCASLCPSSSPSSSDGLCNSKGCFPPGKQGECTPLPLTSSLTPALCSSSSQGSFPPSPSLQSLCSTVGGSPAFVGFPSAPLTAAVCPAAEPCSLPLDEGGCRRYTLRWYHSQRGAECRPFVYSGCGGNSNRFDSREECELRCGQRFLGCSQCGF